MFDHGGRGRGHDGGGGGNGGGSKAPERTPAQKADDAKTIADNFDVQLKLVRVGVADMETAAAAGDLAGWATAKKHADAALEQVARIAQSAPAAANDAADLEVRKRLASAEQTLQGAQRLVAQAPAAPQPRAPELSCADALLAALPPDPPPAEWRDADFRAAADAVKAVFTRQMTTSDIAAFRAIVNRHKDHDIARRFRRFGERRRDGLLKLLDEDKVKLAARAREAAHRAQAVGSMAPSQAPAVDAAPTVARPPEPQPADNHTVEPSAGQTALQRSASSSLDKSKEAQRLHAMIAMRQQPQIVKLLEQNSNPEHMYALHRAYGSTLVADVRSALTEAAYLARARVYLGEQMALDAKIETRGTGDVDAILGDFERLSDARALALFSGDAVPIVWTQPAQGTWLPATTTLAAVQQALHRRLNPDDYYRAMRVLLAKAERAIAVEVAQAPPGQSLEGFTVTLDDLAIDPSWTGSHASPLALSPVSRARVDLAEACIREADASGNWMADPMKGRAAMLALTDLSHNERQALALRLHDRPLVNVIGGGDRLAGGNRCADRRRDRGNHRGIGGQRRNARPSRGGRDGKRERRGGIRGSWRGAARPQHAGLGVQGRWNRRSGRHHDSGGCVAGSADRARRGHGSPGGACRRVCWRARSVRRATPARRSLRP